MAKAKIRTADQIKRGVMRALQEWRPILGLDRWQIAVYWQSPEDAMHGGDSSANASTVATPEYSMARMYFNVENIRTGRDGASDKHLASLVVHELAHCLTWSLANAAQAVMVDEWWRRELEAQNVAVTRALWVARYGEELPE